MTSNNELADRLDEIAAAGCTLLTQTQKATLREAGDALRLHEFAGVVCGALENESGNNACGGLPETVFTVPAGTRGIR